MNAKKQIRALAKELGWRKQDLHERLLQPGILPAGLRRKLARSVPANGSDLIDTLTTAQAGRALGRLTDRAPFEIAIDNIDGTSAEVAVFAISRVLAQHKPTINGSRWQFYPNEPEPYTTLEDHPALVQELEAMGYVVNTDNYTQPTLSLHDSYPELDIDD